MDQIHLPDIRMLQRFIEPIVRAWPDQPLFSEMLPTAVPKALEVLGTRNA